MGDPVLVLTQLRRADRVLAGRSITPGADLRIRERLRLGPRRKPARPPWAIPAFAAAACAAVVMILGLWQPWEPMRLRIARSAPAVTQSAGFTHAEPSCIASPIEDGLTLDGRCGLTLDTPRMTLQSFRSARIRRADDGVRLLSGTVLFEVASVDRGDGPVRVYIPAGVIEVIGTRFTVHHSGTRGYVDLHEGKIRLIDHTGAAVAIEAGRRLRWANGRVSSEHRPADTESVEPPQLPTQGRASEPRRRVMTGGVTALIGQITRLRTQGRYREAVRLLVKARKRRWDSRTAEVLSYEQGTILASHLDDRQRACRHWRSHLRRFPRGRYRESVARSLAKLTCE